MSELDDRLVKRGFWINWEQGAVMGRTITTDARTGNIVIALLTILTSVSSAQLWGLITFFIHQWRARGVPADSLYWQQQALLRTLPTPSTLISDSVKLWWVRRRQHRALLRTWSHTLLAACFLVGSIAAGILSSGIVSTTDLQVLVNSGTCGVVDPGNATDFAYLTPVTSALLSYALECYKPGPFLPKRCQQIFVSPNVSIELTEASCPWEASMCTDKYPAPVRFDSGYLDGNRHLGLNLRNEDAVRFRKTTTCNILPQEGHTIMVNSSYYDVNDPTPAPPNQQSIGLRYGKFPDNSSALHVEDTFKFKLPHNYRSGRYSTDTQHIKVKPRPGERQIIPLAEMQRPDADIALIAIGLDNVMYWEEPVDDPLFAAHKKLDFRSQGNYTYYVSDQYVGVMGCAMQYEFCFAQKGRSDFCSSPGGVPLQISPADFQGASENQIAVLDALRRFAYLNDITNTFEIGEVLAGRTATDAVLGPLPDDQYLKELLFAESFAYAGLQFMLSDYAIGPKRHDESADDYTSPPTTLGQKNLCRAVKMRKSGGFANINVFGLAFISTFAFVSTICNFFILRMAIFLSKFRRALAPKIDRWVQEGVFQLQRRAFEANGEGTWYDRNEEIPLTADIELLAELPVDTPSRWEKLLTRSTESSLWKGRESAVGVKEVSRDEVDEPCRQG
ncbi:hypothetical protein EJ04DRAFT_577282 [Polyplosphaeria fusca]|uniref:Uncharacterized protein n=1 Tax=Polyplosphaeria fusca TaxID=682080 RepID=A0A9P4QYU2_9PLEO|nr:hypothetical protein EJ04DRAFT_577282 [Polyplosphaeria fusca]